MNKQTLFPAIQRGDVAVSTIDDKVRRILRTALEFGFFDREQTDLTIPLYSQSGRELALEEARGGMVLLKNENGILPLDKNKLKFVAVLGPDAYPAVIGGGGSSLSTPFSSVSYLVSISDYLGKNARVDYVVEELPLDSIVDSTQFVTAVGGSRGLRGEYFNTVTAVERADRGRTIEVRWWIPNLKKFQRKSLGLRFRPATKSSTSRGRRLIRQPGKRIRRRRHP